MFRKILHPTDFSETAFQAFGHAVALAERQSAALELLHVLRMHDFAMIELEKGHAMLEEAYDGLERTLKQRAPALLAGATEDLPWSNMVFRRGYSVAEEVILEASAQETDLIVIGTHGCTPVRRFFLGSVAETVVRYAPCPVLVCGRGGRAPERFSRILVPVDFSEASVRAAEMALGLARLDGSEAQFLHVIEDKAAPSYLDEGTSPRDDPHVHNAAARELERFIDGLDTDGVATSRQVVVGKPSRAIAEQAEEHGFDLIALGTSGLRGISRFLLGSTPARVLRRCTVPVLAVHGRDDEADD